MALRLSSIADSLVRDVSLPLTLRIYRLVCGATAAICLIVIPPVNWWQHLPIWVNVGDIVLGLCGVFCLRESWRGRHHLAAFFIALVLLLDGVWFFNAGTEGSITYYFFPAALYPVAVFRGRLRWIATLLLAGNVCALMLLEYNQPAWVTPFVTPTDRLVDLVSGVICSGLALVLVLWLVVRTYDGEHERLELLARDLAESEQRLRLALEASKQSWFELDLTTQRGVVGENPSRVGHPAQRFEMSLAAWKQDLHPDDRDAALRAFETCAATGENVNFEHRTKTAGGGWKWLRALAKGVDGDAAGKPRRIIGTLTDITQLKQLEGELWRSQRLESVGILAGGVAHHVNNLLTPVLIGTELLNGRQTSAADRALLAQMKDGATRVTAIVRELVTFSQAKGRFRVWIDLPVLLDEWLDAARGRLAPGIGLDAHVAKDLWPVNVDPVQLQQAISNLISNAGEAMPRGGTVTVTAVNTELAPQAGAAEAVANGGKFVRISVADTGRGISPENLPHIFDPFFTTKEVGHGPGLGLSTVYGVVAGHGGTITVNSEPGRGANFVLLLPAALAEATGHADL